MPKHNYDNYRIKKIFGADIDVKKYDTYKKLRNFIIEDSETKNKFFEFVKKDERNQVRPNIIIFLKKFGFDIDGCLRKNIVGGNSKYHDITYDGKIVFSTQYPTQVYYTNKIFENLLENEYFKEHYTEGDLLDEDLIKIEKRVVNEYANYNQIKYLDISIYSKYNRDKNLIIEINEYEHSSKQTEDKKRYDDLKYRKNTQDIDFIGPFTLMLNKNCEVVKSQVDKLVEEVIEWLQIVDNCADEKKYVINYLVKNCIGKKKWCELLYDSYCDINKCIVDPNIILSFFNKFMTKSNKKIISDYVEYKKDYLYRLKEINNEICDINFIENNGEIKLNYDGVGDFFQYLYANEDLFKNQIEHYRISQYFTNCQRTMMKAIKELFALQNKLLNINKYQFFYGSYE